MCNNILASKQSERDTIRSVLVHVGTYIWTYMCHNSRVCTVYVMWAELGPQPFHLGENVM